MSKTISTTARLSTIRLGLARTKAFPFGSDRHGYRFIAPLDETGHIDAEAWKHNRDRCRVVRFWGGEEEDIGHLVHRPGGKAGATWGFRYDVSGDEGDEDGYRFGAHAFRPGEYVSIRDEDGELNTFRVLSVTEEE